MGPASTKSQVQQSQQLPQQQQPHQQHTDVVENESLQSLDIVHEEGSSSLEPDVTLHSSAPSDSVISVSADPCVASVLDVEVGESVDKLLNQVVEEVNLRSSSANLETEPPCCVKSNLNPTAAEWTPDASWIPASEDVVRYVTCAAAITTPMTEDRFFQLEAMGTTVNPKCGGCKCGKCPVPGSLFSFKEQTEYDKILSNLVYRADQKRWFTTLPWKSSRNALPRNEKAALRTLQAMEKSLAKKPTLAEEFNEGIRAMIERGSAVPLSKEVLDDWNGDYYYLPIVGVQGKKSLRVCFDASRKQCGCESMNYHLCKGPDRFMNDLLSVLLAFRNGRVGCAGDIKKFHNQVHLMEEDMHMQRFLWRFMETDEEPQHFAIPVNNFGVKPANCIATCALRSSADQFSQIYPVESEEVKNQTYIDDQLTAAENNEAARRKTNDGTRSATTLACQTRAGHTRVTK